MSVDRRRTLFFGAAVALRLLAFATFPTVPDLLTDRVEVSTPINSFKRLQEGLFLYTHHVSPYDGGVYHQAPLLLPLFSLLPKASDYPLATGLLYTLLDLLNANALARITSSGEATSPRKLTSPRAALRWDGTSVGAAYLFNPFTLAACLGRSTSMFTNTAIIHAIANACDGNSVLAMVALAFASYLSLYPILLLPPLVLLSYDRYANASTTTKLKPALFIAQHLGLIIASIALLLYLSYLSTTTPHSWSFIRQTYGFQLLVPDLTPNSGLWWYFFIEMFDPFREFFLGVFWLHLTGYVGGLTLRLSRQPLFVLASLLGIFATFKPYPSISDVSLYLALLPLYRHVFPLLRFPFIATAVLLYATFLGPAFHYLWIYAGSGNANFFYAITLVWNLGLAILVADSIYAVLRDEWEAERPEMKGKEAVRI